MITGIDHFIVAVRDVDAAARELARAVRLEAGEGGRHEAHGTRNRLCWLGDSYIELMSVFGGALAERSWFGRHAQAVVERTGEGPMGFVIASDDLAGDVERLRTAGSSLGVAEEGERLRPDGRIVRWRLARPPDADPELGLVFLIEHDTAAAEWTTEDRARRARHAHPLGGPAQLVRVEMPVADMRATTMRLHRDLGLAFRPSLAGGGARDTTVGVQTLRLVPRTSGSPPTVVVRGGPTAREATALGCRWVVEPGAG